MSDQPSNPQPRPHRRNTDDLAGRRFGRLVVTTFAGYVLQGKQRNAMWNCTCDCGGARVFRATFLKRGRASSCGCLVRERGRTFNRSHGQSRAPEYVVWQNMKKRCLDPGYRRFKDYGGRGVKICDRWLASFENFFADMGSRPSPKHSIERKNNDGNYEPGNCEWATRHKQDRNKRTSRLLAHGGRSMTVGDWAKEAGISARTLRFRLESGMPLSEAISRPIDKRYSRHKS